MPRGASVDFASLGAGHRYALRRRRTPDLRSIVMDNLLIDLDREMASTRRLLERYPLGKGEWQPHDKSRTLSALATHVANIPHHGANILTTAEMDVASQ